MVTQFLSRVLRLTPHVSDPVVVPTVSCRPSSDHLFVIGLQSRRALLSYDLAIDALFFNWVVKNKDRLQRVMYASSSAAYPIERCFFSLDISGHADGERRAPVPI